MRHPVVRQGLRWKDSGGIVTPAERFEKCAVATDDMHGHRPRTSRPGNLDVRLMIAHEDDQCIVFYKLFDKSLDDFEIISQGGDVRFAGMGHVGPGHRKDKRVEVLINSAVANPGPIFEEGRQNMKGRMTVAQDDVDKKRLAPIVYFPAPDEIEDKLVRHGRPAETGSAVTECRLGVDLAVTEEGTFRPWSDRAGHDANGTVTGGIEVFDGGPDR